MEHAVDDACGCRLIVTLHGLVSALQARSRAAAGSVLIPARVPSSRQRGDKRRHERQEKQKQEMKEGGTRHHRFAPQSVFYYVFNRGMCVGSPHEGLRLCGKN